jgi:dTMP kinase
MERRWPTRPTLRCRWESKVAGLFITLEGIDGCGKTTQARLLAEWLRGMGHSVVLTREPGGTPVGRTIRELLLAEASAGCQPFDSAQGRPAPRAPEGEITAEAELFLYLADRALHVAQVVRPALGAGEIVVCERHADSTLAYQGYGRGLDLGLLNRLNAMATGGLAPDLTIVLDIPANKAWLDAARLDRLESEGVGFSARVAEGFRALAREEPDRVKLIAGSPGIEAVHAEVAALVRELLEAGKREEGS